MAYKRKKDAFNLRLIAAVKEHECLWNAHHKEFYSKGRAARAWQKIAGKLDKEVPFLKAKWKNIRDTYRKEVKKNMMDDQYLGMWLYFEDMDFIRETVDVSEKNDQESVEDDVEQEVSLNSPESDHEEPNYLFLNDESPQPSKKSKMEQESNTVNENILSKMDCNIEDQFDEQFLVSLLPFFRKMTPLRKLKLRSKIQEAVVAELRRNI